MRGQAISRASACVTLERASTRGLERAVTKHVGNVRAAKHLATDGLVPPRLSSVAIRYMRVADEAGLAGKGKVHAFRLLQRARFELIPLLGLGAVAHAAQVGHVECGVLVKRVQAHALEQAAEVADVGIAADQHGGAAPLGSPPRIR